MPSIHPDRLLYEDQHLLIVNKRAGELVVAAEGEGKLPLLDYLKEIYPGLRAVHRLDFGTSGVIVFARSAAALEQIRKTKFAGWKKTYRAIVAGVMPKNKEYTINKPLKARTNEDLIPAVTHVKALECFLAASYVEARIDTGRKHQIRQHLASFRHPLVCDPLYGDPKLDRGFRKVCHQRKFLLHAYSLDFPHPMTGVAVHAEAALPQAFEDALKKLRAQHNG